METLDMDLFVQTICAFSNRSGGTIYIGVSEPLKSMSPEDCVVGARLNDILGVVNQLHDYFDDPLPELRVEKLDLIGDRGPLVSVQVEKNSSQSQPTALADLTIWFRSGSENRSITRKSRRRRDSSNELGLEDELRFQQDLNIEVERSNKPTEGTEHVELDVPERAGELSGTTHVSLGTKGNITGIITDAVWTSRFQRDSSDREVALDADGYAEVISKVLANANDKEQMSLAIFGHWGRGKTFLAKKVMQRLEDQENGKEKYSTVLFSAWKYRTNPEVWAYLFERFLQEAKTDNYLITFCASLIRIGPWPLILSMFGLFFSLWTIGESLDLLKILIQAVGIGTVLYGIFLFVRFRSISVRLQTLYSFSSHSDKLGLQAAIGEDLCALLKAWCPKDLKKFKKTWFIPILFYLFASLLISWKLWPVKEANTWMYPLLGEISMGINPIVAFVFYALWCLFWIGIPFVVWNSLVRSSTDRILLVVDDLDRCEPNQMLEIIESTMLILDDEDVHERLQVCMLIDENAFKHALLEKYNQLLDNTPDSYELGESLNRGYSKERIIRENIEKYFLVYLRLTDLTDEDIIDVMESYVRQLSENMEPQGLTDKTLDAEGDFAEPVVENEFIDNESESNIEDVKTENEVMVMHPLEAEEILKSVKKYLSGQRREIVGPRTLRCLLFRYQLAREILSELGEAINPTELANSIVAYYANEESPERVSVIVERVVKQVS